MLDKVLQSREVKLVGIAELDEGQRNRVEDENCTHDAADCPS
jgi:hypothetical protein